jgi:hypothetical protein
MIIASKMSCSLPTETYLLQVNCSDDLKKFTSAKQTFQWLRLHKKKCDACVGIRLQQNGGLRFNTTLNNDRPHSGLNTFTNQRDTLHFLETATNRPN